MKNGLSLKKTKTINMSTVLKTIYGHGPIARADISRLTQLSPTTCTAITKTLMQEGVVQEVGEGRSSGGRKPILLQLNKDYGYVIGVERGEKFIKCNIYNLMFEMIHCEEVEEHSSLEGSFIAIIDCVKLAIQNSCKNNIMGMTVSTHGVIDTINHKIVGDSSLKAEESLDFATLFEDAFDFPVHIENDSNIIAFAEKKLHYPNNDSLVHISVGAGVGAGIVMGEKMIKGRYGYVGEIGHISMDRNGPLCFCGNKGCLETMASKNALYSKIDFGIRSGNAGLLGEWLSEKDESYDLSMILKAAKEGNRFAEDVITEEADLLYHAVINVINLYDPEVITIGGFGLDFTAYIVEYIHNKLKSTIYKYQLDSRTIVASQQRGDLAQVGAAICSLNYLIEDNILAKTLIDGV